VTGSFKNLVFVIFFLAIALPIGIILWIPTLGNSEKLIRWFWRYDTKRLK
jgi:hypothetical protein